MGAGGRMSVSGEGKDVLERVPCTKPPFTLGELKKAVPPHCFERSALRSSYHVLHDVVIAALLYYVALNYIPLLPRSLSYVAWPLYWYSQGCILSGLWVIGHDCGHHAYSDYQWLDDAVGYVIHSTLLTPYFSWKISHRRHHSNANSIDRDEVFVPQTKSDLFFIYRILNNPPGRVIRLFTTLTLGFTLYLFLNFTGRKYDRFANHFDPNSPIYNKREHLQVLLSDIGILAAIYGYYTLITTKGLVWFITIQGLPMVVMTSFFILAALLHHTHPAMPHYDSTEWDWMRGALSTVDRDFGILNDVFHNATHTHVLHHLFPSIPHYHGTEATEAVKPILGDYYKVDKTPIVKAMFREAKLCLYVEPSSEKKGVYWFNNKM